MKIDYETGAGSGAEPGDLLPKLGWLPSGKQGIDSFEGQGEPPVEFAQLPQAGRADNASNVFLLTNVLAGPSTQ